MAYISLGLEYIPDKLEDEYFINVWTSAEGSWYALRKLKFKKANLNSTAPITVKIPFGSMKDLRSDTNIWFCVLKRTEADIKTNRSGTTINGHCYLPLSSILDQISSRDKTINKFVNLELIMNNQVIVSDPSILRNFVDMKTGEFRIRKGYLKVSDINLSHPKNQWNLLELAENERLYDYREKTFISGVMTLEMLKDSYIFSGNLKSEDTNLMPMSAEVSQAHSIFWSSSAGYIPSYLYWQERTVHEYDEQMVLNLGELVLSRYNKTKEWFIQEVKKQYISHGKYISEEFRLCVSIIAEMACYPATVLPYTGDYVEISLDTSETSKTKKVFGSLDQKFTKVPTEIFDDAFKNRADDCDGLSRAIYHVSYVMERGLEKYKDKKKFYKRNGSWSSKFLRSIQKVLSELYVSSGQIALVTAARLDNNTKGPKEIIIDSEYDKNVQIGGHVLHIWTPVKYMNDCVETANNSNKLPILRDKQDFYPWENDLPCLVGEGTNMLHPLQKPVADYYPSFEKEKIEKATEYMNTTIKYRKHFLKNNKALASLLRWPREQTNVIGKPNLRINSFYRNWVGMFTTKYLDAGYNFSTFTWGTKDLSDVNYKEPFVYGINAREWLYKEKNVILLPSPSISEKEIKVAKTYLRQLSPRVCPFDSKEYDVDYIYNNEEERTSSIIDNKLTELNRKFKNTKYKQLRNSLKYMDFYLDTSLIIKNIKSEVNMDNIFEQLEVYVSETTQIRSIEFHLEKINKYLDIVKMRIYYKD